MTYFALLDLKSHTTGRIYARQGDEVEVYNTDHAPVMCCRVGGECFPAHIDRLTSERPNAIKQAEKTAAPIKTTKTQTRVEKLQLEYLNSLKK